MAGPHDDGGEGLWSIAAVLLVAGLAGGGLLGVFG